MPEEMMMQILSRLPPKSLMRFRCVHKSWYNFINDPNFVDVHLSKSIDNRCSSKTSTCVLFKRCVLNNEANHILLSLVDLSNDNNGVQIQSNSIQDLNRNNVPPLSVGLRHDCLDIAGHCHGIICLTDFSENVFLCNPALKQLKILPKSCLRLPQPPPKTLNRLQSTGVAVGFGYDSRARVYKVVRIVMHFEGFWILFYPHMAEVYTMSSNSWREIKTDIPSTVVWSSSSSQIYFKGVYYWFALELDKQTLDENKKVMLSFDMDDELFFDTPVPDSLQDSEENYGSLGVWNESIALFSYHVESGVSKFIDIWVMDGFCGIKGSWTKHLTIEPIAGIGMPLTFWNSDELLLVATDGYVVSHNFDTKVLRNLPIHEEWQLKIQNLSHGVRLLIEDYPYAADGLETWSAIKTWVKEYCSFYTNDEMVQNDSELQPWWKELREEGHGDKKDEPWWPKMQTCEELIESCTIIIWLSSAYHAAINYGQYSIGGYVPNRPSISLHFMPEEGNPEYEELKTNPDKAFLKTFTPQLQTLLGMASIEILSRHPVDELFLRQRDTPEWTTDANMLQASEDFRKKMEGIEKRIIKMKQRR